MARTYAIQPPGVAAESRCIMAEISPDGLFSVNILRVCESLDSLADDIEFIASGQADNPRDGDAWERRTNAGRQLVRLRAALNNGELDRADCILDTLAVLRDVWQAIKAFEYGSHRDQPDKYGGPLHLPGEVAPLLPLSESSLKIRKADERYDPYPELRPNLSEGVIAGAISELEQKATSTADDARTNDLAIRALRGLNKPDLTTKRKRWSGAPNKLRALSATLAHLNAQTEIAGQSTDSKRAVAKVQWPDVETLRAISEQARKVSEFIRDALPTTAAKRTFAANAMPAVITELDRLTYLFYGRTLAEYDADVQRTAKLGWWTSLGGWIVATPGSKEQPSLAYHLRPGAQDDAVTYPRYVGWDIPVPQHSDAIWNALSTLRVYFGQIVFHRDWWIRQGAWLRDEIRARMGAGCSPDTSLGPWFDGELCRAPVFALNGPHLAQALRERPPALPETVLKYGTFDAPKTEGVPVEWLDELDHYAKKLSAAISESRNAMLIESLKPANPIPYDPELMQAWAKAADRDWHEYIEEPRREAYRLIMPTIWLEVLEAEQAGDTERLKAIQMRADRQWKEAMGVPAITSYENLAIVMATVQAAGYPATNAGLHAWTIAKANSRNGLGAAMPNGTGDNSRWEVEAGGFKFDGRFYPLVGKPLAVLRVIVDSPRRQTFGYPDLRSAWSDDMADESTIRAALSTLRRSLRKVAADFAISCSDPLPGKQGAWQFALPR
jgi:hypothetical protein